MRESSRIDLSYLGVRALERMLSDAASSSRSSSEATAMRGDSALDRLLARQWSPERIAALRRDLSESTSVVQLAGWKEELKGTLSSCSGDEEKTAIAIFQHAVVAQVYARRGEWITSRTPSELLPVFEDLAHTLGSSKLVGCFSGAVERAIRDEVSF